MILKEALNSSYLKEEAEADPLVVLDISPLLWVDCFVDARVGHVQPHPLPEGAGDGVSRMNPAVGVKDILGDVFGVNTVNGIAHIPGKHSKQIMGHKLPLTALPVPVK